ncbi:lysylphosphatidylglycerol synthase transmembrane domain-containing protein [Pseudomonas fluorescens]|uniref:TIGR00374 family protein n=1 Tax=Pseudomonas fluorescens TaxID=294 RepID=A0A5E7J031_PSEFL|nr:lysylphosphatidylglycerol synthase transmembrane domain-containing protein [Pseudomonas fluorescens]VVO81660.1 hypothetical protein PS880_01837 [Pseudomonas fluorescens]
MSQTPFLSDWRYQVLIGSVAISGLGYLGISLWGGWPSVSRAVSRVGLLGGAQIVALILISYGLRFLRWQVYLNALGHPLRWWPSLNIYLAGFALTTTPGKAGEALRGVLLKRWDVPYASSFAALVSERLSDLMAMVLLALLCLSHYPESLWMIIACLVLAACGMRLASRHAPIEAIGQRISQGRSWMYRLLRYVVRVLHQSRRCHSPRRLLGTMVLSLAAWSLEGLAFYWILTAMNIDVALTFAMFVYAVSMLAGALSFMPGGLGSAEAVMVGLLVSSDVAVADAIAATLVLRLATLWFAVGLGAMVLLRIKDSVSSEYLD